jgi:predicted nuclease of predicted toxin-antitoxin system
VKFKLDENLPVELLTNLRGLGHDVDTVIGEGLRGAADPAVVDAALAADRILFTLDKGIANLQRYPINQHAGVVLFRPNSTRRGAVIAFIRERLSKVLELDLIGRLTSDRPVSGFDRGQSA